MAALSAETGRLAGESERILNDPGYVSFNHQHYSYISRGRYSEQIVRYLNLFPASNLLILESEAFWNSPVPTATEVFKFLGVNDQLSVALPHINATRPSSISDDVKSFLAGQFAKPNADLSALTDRNFTWS
jgi:hypothetical protein